VTPEDIYRSHQEVADMARPWLSKHLQSRRFDGLLNVAGGHLDDLCFLAMMQLRWGFEGLAATVDEMLTLPSLLEEAFAGMRRPWAAYQGRLDGYLRLTYLLDAPRVEQGIFDKWASYTDRSPNLDCMHKCNVALDTILEESRTVTMPCNFTAGKKFALESETYKNYFELADAIVLGDRPLAEAKVQVGVQLYRRRARHVAGPAYYGYGNRNSYLFDFQLTAMIEFARRAKGWDLVVDEPYANTYATVLKNAAAFREQNSPKG